MPLLRAIIDTREIVIGDNPRADIPYIVSGASSEDEAISFCESAIPQNFRDLKRSDIRIGLNFNGDDSWFVTASYVPQTITIINNEKISFDIGGETQHINASLRTVGRYGPKASDLGGALNYDGERVNGLDITFPVFNFTIEKTFPISVVTDSYLDKIARLARKVNSKAFRGKAAGEVFFHGASGSESDDGQEFTVAFKFSFSSNRSGITIGDIGGISKKGWEYLWVRYADKVDDAKKQIIQKPVAVYVEQVYETASFSGLGIG